MFRITKFLTEVAVTVVLCTLVAWTCTGLMGARRGKEVPATVILITEGHGGCSGKGPTTLVEFKDGMRQTVYGHLGLPGDEVKVRRYK